MRWPLVLAAALLTGCGNDPTARPPDPDDPDPVQTCARGERPTHEGTCIAVGLSADDCADGFAFDPLDGCMPILPDEPCAAGMMALLGETTCHLVAECPPGPWPTELGPGVIVYVSATADPAVADGTMSAPFVSVVDAVAAAPDDATIAIAPGTYQGSVIIIDRALHLRGLCPSQVAIVGEEMNGAVELRNANGSSVRNVALTGAGVGLFLLAAVDIVAESLWIHDTPVFGVYLRDELGRTELALSGSLIEEASYGGIALAAGNMVLERSVIRSTHEVLPGSGYGVAALEGKVSGEVSDVVIDRAVIHDHYRSGLVVEGSTARVTASYVASVKSSGVDDFSVGIYARLGFDNTALLSAVDIEQSVVASTREAGILFQGATGSIDRCVVHDSLPHPDGTFGHGVVGQLPQTQLSLSRSLVRDFHHVGVLVGGATIDIDDCWIRDASGSAPSRGVTTQIFDPALPLATVSNSLIENTAELGIFGLGGGLRVEDTAVLNVIGNDDERFGDGITVIGTGTPDAPIVLQRTFVANSSRAGISAFGATVLMVDNRLECNTIQLVGDVFDDVDFLIIDDGDNDCACGAVTSTCKVISSETDPPAAL
jgi:hypothetical protein